MESKDKGRFSMEVPTNNLQEPDDSQVFDPEEEEATPRTSPPGAILQVDYVDMCQGENKSSHYTGDYDLENLVVRRGQEFLLKISFNRPLLDQDDFQLEFLIGPNPSPHKGSLVVVPFGSRGGGGAWAGRILDASTPTVVLGVTPSPTAIVGKFRTYVAISVGNGMKRTKRNTATDLYLLFNAWCPDDPVFLPDESARFEYVLNDVGVIFQGSASHMSQRTWVYGQFERGVLDSCIYVLDACRMPIANRGNVIKLVRKGSAMINSQDDNGVLVGNWGNDFSMGTPPTAWTGSVKILLKYANTGVPVNYAQCWVYAGVFNTFLRCLGIPSRVVTNFSSAHDNTGNLKTDLIFKMDGTPDRRHTRDSIWNYHCWNEAYILRKDLPIHLSGWQCVDATPQETSDGHYRCGPASVNAIKDGLVCHPFDAGFVFAEVNSDVVFHKRDRYGTLTAFKVDSTLVGQALYTKAVGSMAPVDITHTYKYPEGSAEDEKSMHTAEKFGCERDHSDVPVGDMSVKIFVQPVQLGTDVKLEIVFTNQGSVEREVQAHLESSVIFYTGVSAHHFQTKDFSVFVAAYDTTMVEVVVTAEEYMPNLNSQLSLQFVVTGQSLDQSMTDSKVVDLNTPQLPISVEGELQVKKDVVVTVHFRNNFSFPLYNVYLYMDGPGVTLERMKTYDVIYPTNSITWVEVVQPWRPGLRRLVAMLYCSSIPNLWGEVMLSIAPL